MQTIDYYYAHGKLLLTGEYLVLDGAPALAAPTQSGQWLEVTTEKSNRSVIHWESYNVAGKRWFDAQIELTNWELNKTNHQETGQRLVSILQALANNNPAVFQPLTNYYFTTTLEFPNEWGLGTSSTLIANLAKWSSTNPYQLLEASFGGSGYDIACAHASGPLQYERNAGQPIIAPIDFHPTFDNQLAFLYLGQKQNSRSGIARYREKKKGFLLHESIEQLKNLNKRFLEAETLVDFEKVLAEHETLISSVIEIPPIQEQLFPDYEGQIKSLGAWGGDFAMVTLPNGWNKAQKYFAAKGLSILIPYREMISTIYTFL